MVSNDVILLADMLEQSQIRMGTLLTASEHDTYFAAGNYLAERHVSHDDLMSGIVDGERDGGLDAIFVFVDGLCIRDDASLRGLGRNPQIDLVLLQVKNSSGFGEDAINRLLVSLPEIFSLDRDERGLASRYNGRVIEVSRRFLQVYRDADLPQVRVQTCFASLKAEHLHENTQQHASRIDDLFRSLFGGCESQTSFLNAAAVADLARRPRVITKELVFAENAISTDMRGGYVGVVKLSEFEKFIREDDGTLNATLFEANVRDYDATTEVNENIKSTLEKREDNVDFWWLNNGITIVASDVQTKGGAKYFQLRSPQIVNGLQTSHEIYKRSRAGAAASDDRSVLVKIIQVEQSEVRDRIIRATNSQTSLNLSSLRATDKVQRQIEEFLKKSHLYYERRKHLYTNLNHRPDEIVSIDQMGQALLSVMLQVPNLARSSSSIIFDDEIYDRLFGPNNPVQCYLTCIQILRHAQRYVSQRADVREGGENFHFHLAMMIGIRHAGRAKPNAKDLSVPYVELGDAVMSRLFRELQECFAHYTRVRGETLFERLAKAPDLPDMLRDRVRKPK